MVTKYEGLSKDEFIRELDWIAASNQQIDKDTVCLPSELVLEAIQRLRDLETEEDLEEEVSRLCHENAELLDEIDELKEELKVNEH